VPVAVSTIKLLAGRPRIVIRPQPAWKFLLAGVNFVTNILKMRATGMSYMRMPGLALICHAINALGETLWSRTSVAGRLVRFCHSQPGPIGA
jgi:hypothetical protein